LFELSEEDRDAEVKDDPLGVGFAESGELEEVGGGKVVEGSAEEDDDRSADEGDEPPAALEDAEGALAIVAGDHHGHLVAGDAAEAGVAEAEVGGDGVDDHPLAVERRDPVMEKDGDLDELDDGRGKLADPVDDEAKEQPSLCVAIHGHDVFQAMNVSTIELIDTKDLTKALHDSPYGRSILMLYDMHNEVLLKKGERWQAYFTATFVLTTNVVVDGFGKDMGAGCRCQAHSRFQ